MPTSRRSAACCPIRQQAALEAVLPLWHTLDQEFASWPSAIWGQWMAPEKLARLDAIASRTWLRTLDDRLGISQEERKRHQEALPSPAESRCSPTRRCISSLAPSTTISPDTTHGASRCGCPPTSTTGERYNLAIGRGTLTEEERYKINDHIIQTIRMLEKLLPRHLRKVPEIGGPSRADGRHGLSAPAVRGR